MFSVFTNEEAKALQVKLLVQGHLISGRPGMSVHVCLITLTYLHIVMIFVKPELNPLTEACTVGWCSRGRALFLR